MKEKYDMVLEDHPEKKIVFLVSTLGPYGAEQACMRVAEGVKQQGMDVKIVVTDISPNVKVDSVPIVSLLHGSPLNIFTEILYAPYQFLKLYQFLKREKADIVVSFMERSNIFNMLMPGNFRRVISIRTYLRTSFRESGWIRRFLTKPIYKYLIHRADRVVFNAKGSAEDFKKMFPADSASVKVIHNNYNVDRIRELGKEPLDPEHEELFNGKTILHVGRFSKDKGQWYLIRAFKKVLDKIPDVRLVFLGDGEMFDFANQLASELGIDQRVHFLGVQKNPYKFMSRATLLGFTSLWEGFPNALSEALINGMAVIATDCASGPRELLAPDSDVEKVASDVEETQFGLLVPPFDGEIKDVNVPLANEEKIYVEGLMQLLQNEELCKKYRELSSVRMESFRNEVILDEWANFLKNL